MDSTLLVTLLASGGIVIAIASLIFYIRRRVFNTRDSNVRDLGLEIYTDRGDKRRITTKDGNIVISGNTQLGRNNRIEISQDTEDVTITETPMPDDEE